MTEPLLPEIVQSAPLGHSPLLDDGPGDVVRAFFEGRSPNTRDAYERDLMVFAKFLVENKAIPGPVTKTFDPKVAARVAQWYLGVAPGKANLVALRYRTWLLGLGHAGVTVDRRMSALKSLVRIGRLLGIINWAIEVAPAAKAGVRTREVRGPGKDGVRAMQEVVRRRLQDAATLRRNHPHRSREAVFDALRARRDHAILRVLFDMALRRSEAAALTLADLDFQTKRVSVRRKGDGGATQVITLPDQTVPVILRWLDFLKRAGGPTGPEAPLFVPLNNQKIGVGMLTDEGVYRVIVSLGKDAGLKTWPHGLRHAAITEALDRTNGDVRAVAKFSGHRKIETVMRYDDDRKDTQGEIANQVAEGL